MLPDDLPNRRTILGLAAGGAVSLGGCNPMQRDPLPDIVNLAPVPGLTTALGSPLPGLKGSVFRRSALVLNVWASWCPYCQGEHDTLMALARDPNLMLAGIVYRDRPEAARDYLRKTGVPFRALGVDSGGWVWRHLGQSGVPHTYVVDKHGKVVEVLPGALTRQWVESRLRPAYERAKATA